MGLLFFKLTFILDRYHMPFPFLLLFNQAASNNNSIVAEPGTAAGSSNSSGDGYAVVALKSSGGGVLFGTGIMSYVPSAFTVLGDQCLVNTAPFLTCRVGYVPTITRCNQKLTASILKMIQNRSGN